MSERSAVQKAVREAMQTEKDAMDFYCLAAEKLDHPRAKEIFLHLAREERQHACSFFVVYRGGDIPSFEDFLESPANTASEWWKCLDALAQCGFDERRAFELALGLEESLEQSLREAAGTIEDAGVRAIYLANANSTHKHYELIAQRYRELSDSSPPD